VGSAKSFAMKVNDATPTRAVRRRFETRTIGPVRSPRVTAGRSKSSHSILMGCDAPRVAGAGVVEGASEPGAMAIAATAAAPTTTIRPRLRKDSARLIGLQGIAGPFCPIGLCYWSIPAPNDLELARSTDQLIKSRPSAVAQLGARRT
jgi:hypothetical protein